MNEVGAQTAILNGHEFSYVDIGEGPAVLFIHGLTGSHRNWAHLVDRLKTDHRVLAPDLFGHWPRPQCCWPGPRRRWG